MFLASFDCGICNICAFRAYKIRKKRGGRVWKSYKSVALRVDVTTFLLSYLTFVVIWDHYIDWHEIYLDMEIRQSLSSHYIFIY